MKKILFALFALALAVSAYGLWHSEEVSAPGGEVTLKGASGNTHTEIEYFKQLAGFASVNASSTTSNNVALGAGAHGQITIGTGTPATNLVNASTTAVTQHSMVFLQQSATTTIPGTTCNSTATTTPIVNITASSTNPSQNGFTATLLATPVTNPVCLNYWIFQKSN